MIFTNNLETRKQNTQYIISEAEDFCSIFTNNKKLAGIVLATIHTIVIFLASFHLIFTTQIDYLFYVCLIFWIVIACMHIYFNGCILIKIERELLDNKKWYAGWTPFFLLAEKYSSEKIPTKALNNFFICFGIFVSCIIFLKFLYLY